MSAIGAIFDIMPVLQTTKKILGTQNNVFLDAINWRPWVELELGFILNESNAFTQCEDESIFLGDLGLPTQVVIDARDTMRRELSKLLREAFGIISAVNEYEYTFLSTDTYGTVYNLRVINRGNKRLLELERKEKEELMFAESGGYVPERLRTSY